MGDWERDIEVPWQQVVVQCLESLVQAAVAVAWNHTGCVVE